MGDWGASPAPPTSPLAPQIGAREGSRDPHSTLPLTPGGSHSIVTLSPPHLTSARGPILGTTPSHPPKPGEGRTGTRETRLFWPRHQWALPSAGGTSRVGTRETQAGLAWGHEGAPPFFGVLESPPGPNPCGEGALFAAVGLQRESGGCWGVPRGLSQPRCPPGGGSCSPGGSCLAMHMPRGAWGGLGGAGLQGGGVCLVLPFLGAHGCHCHRPSVLQCPVGLMSCSWWPRCPHRDSSLWSCGDLGRGPAAILSPEGQWWDPQKRGTRWWGSDHLSCPGTGHSSRLSPQCVSSHPHPLQSPSDLGRGQG